MAMSSVCDLKLLSIPFIAMASSTDISLCLYAAKDLIASIGSKKFTRI